MFLFAILFPFYSPVAIYYGAIAVRQPIVPDENLNPFYWNFYSCIDFFFMASLTHAN